METQKKYSNKLGSSVLTMSNPACNVLVGENVISSSELAAKSTDADINKSIKPSISSTSSPSSAGNPAANGNNGVGDTASQATGSTSSIGGKITKNPNVLRRKRRSIVKNAADIIVQTNINIGPNINNVKQLGGVQLTSSTVMLNEQSVQAISLNSKHSKLADTFMQNANDTEARTFLVNGQVSINGQSKLADTTITMKDANSASDAATATAQDNDEKLHEEGSGFEFDAISIDSSTVKYEQEEIESSGYSLVKPIPFIENNESDHQFDESDTNAEKSNIENQQQRKLDVSDSILDDIEPTEAQVKTNQRFASDFNTIDIDSNENGADLHPKTAPRSDFNENFELITESFHESTVDDTHDDNDAFSSTSEMEMNRKDFDSTISDSRIPQPLVVDGVDDRNDASKMQIDHNSNDKINRKSEDIDSTLQNDSPVIIAPYDKQPTVHNKLNLNSVGTQSGVNERPKPLKENASANAIVNENGNEDDGGSELNSKQAQIKQVNEVSLASENSIDGNGYVETASGMKHQEPRYGMLDATTHNDSTGTKDVPNMQRILVNVSIATDSGDGTKNHGTGNHKSQNKRHFIISYFFIP